MSTIPEAIWRPECSPKRWSRWIVTIAALSIPMQAVAGAEDKATLLVVDAQNQLQQKEVRLGMETPDQREVLSGLSEGDLVVVGKAAGLRPGIRVRPQETK